MAALYHDASRWIEFVDRVKKCGPVSGPELCQVDLLEWSPGNLFTTQNLIHTNAQALKLRAKPRLQVVFAPLDVANNRTGAGIQTVFDHYAIPSDFVSQRLEAVTHSFGANYDKSTYCSWFHFLCKHFTLQNAAGQPRNIAEPSSTVLSQGDWTWVRTSVFMRWSDCHDKDSASVTLVIFSASLELRNRLQRLWDNDLSEVLVDPFSLFVICLDELWLQAQGIVRMVGAEFNRMERLALDMAHDMTLQAGIDRDQGKHDFVGLHNMAKHILHLKEGSAAAELTMAHFGKFHQELQKEPPQGEAARHTMRSTGQILAQKAVQFEVWDLRMTSLQQRMQNVINLSFNLVTQHDSHVMKNDSKSMKAIASVTMAFLPLATIAAIFGSEFFNFEDQSGKMLVANNFWIFWALTGPLSLAVFCTYFYLCYVRGSSPRLWKPEWPWKGGKTY